MKYDFLIVGAGFFGSTFARTATNDGKKCLVIDKLDYLGGMAADTVIENVNVARHGAHIFHTNNSSIWNFVNQFGKFNNFVNRVKAVAKDKVYSFPLNLFTFYQLWGTKTPKEAMAKIKETIIPCNNPKNCEEWMLSMVGKEIYELFFYGYTKKQWGCEPSQLPPSIIQRLPIRLTYDDNYFNTKYQGMPVLGYNELVKKMLDGIDFELGVDFFDMKWQKIAKNLIFTGPIDKFYKYCYGKLCFNTLKFEVKTFYGDYQGNAVINHCDLNVPYLRSIEFKHFSYSPEIKHYKEIKPNKTIVSFDLPSTLEETQNPYYPIQNEINYKLYKKYENLNSHNVFFGGRLGEYKYYDIDQTIASAVNKYKKIKGD